MTFSTSSDSRSQSTSPRRRQPLLDNDFNDGLNYRSDSREREQDRPARLQNQPIIRQSWTPTRRIDDQYQSSTFARRPTNFQTPQRRGQSSRQYATDRFRQPQTMGQYSQRTNMCFCCGRSHENDRRYCFAANLSCFQCGRRGHMARFCRSVPRSNVPPLMSMNMQ